MENLGTGVRNGELGVGECVGGKNSGLGGVSPVENSGQGVVLAGDCAWQKAGLEVPGGEFWEPGCVTES